MQAIVVERLGGPEVLALRDVPDPVPGDGEVLVDVEAAGVFWLDTRIRRGQGPPRHAAAPPYVPGGTVAGTVTAIGAHVDPALLGTRVAGRGRDGGYAERVAAAAADLVPVPDGLDAGAAVALFGDGNTALALLESTPVRRGEHVLVLPAAGGAGSLLVQLVAAAGGRVTGLVRGAERGALVLGLGAEHVVDHVVEHGADHGAGHGSDGWVEQVHALVPAGPAVVFDGVGGPAGRSAAWLVADGGRYTSYGVAGGPPPLLGAVEARARRLTVTGMDRLAGFAADRPRRARELFARAAAGELRPLIGAEYPLPDAARAHADLERRRSTGTLVLRP
ncbi:quinone oxidoreductase family protein [Pseudonocardia spirodelae]|uniref:Zinc-binding dehydrogenase n=1 Tax=Pseudonocardia spirodelae TaxID=3133431 RepID=A0ABU8T9T5_9PSEU